jgi:hypothetical protein
MWRELDSRETADGLTVTLEWEDQTDELQVLTVDWANEASVRCIRAFPRDVALDVFEHPFGWATPQEMPSCHDRMQLRKG